MADEKKPEGKPEGKPAPKPDKDKDKGNEDPFAEIIWLIASLFIGLYIVNRLLKFISDFLSADTRGGLLNALFNYLAPFLFWARVISFFFSFGAVIWIVYLYNELIKFRVIEDSLLYPEVLGSAEASTINHQWERILNHIESLNENDWRLAILEADIMLAGLLDAMSLPGDTVAEKLKAVEVSDFTTVENAWEAHRIRNQVVHEGSSFMLNEREARRVIELYGSVFSEFQII